MTTFINSKAQKIMNVITNKKIQRTLFKFKNADLLNLDENHEIIQTYFLFTMCGMTERWTDTSNYVLDAHLYSLYKTTGDID